MKDITHVARPNLPWRDENATECGIDASKHPTWTREEAVAKAKELGRQRFSMFVCMTCMGTAERHSTWDDDPASCLSRYCDRYTLRWREETDERRQFASELRALAMLAEAHRSEFDELVAGLMSTDDLAAARADKRARERYAR